MKKRGLFFYYFTKSSPKKITCDIDLVDQKYYRDEIKNWNIIATKKTLYKNLYRVYYSSENSKARLLKNYDTQFDYYSFYQQRFMVLSFCTLAPIGLLFALLSATIRIPDSIIFGIISLLLPFIYFIRNNNYCEKK